MYIHILILVSKTYSHTRTHMYTHPFTYIHAYTYAAYIQLSVLATTLKRAKPALSILQYSKLSSLTFLNSNDDGFGLSQRSHKNNDCSVHVGICIYVCVCMHVYVCIIYIHVRTLYHGIVRLGMEDVVDNGGNLMALYVCK